MWRTLHVVLKWAQQLLLREEQQTVLGEGGVEAENATTNVVSSFPLAL